MDILISNSCGSPIYQQIYDQVKNAILSGELREGGYAAPAGELLKYDLA